ncbi:hypothetical protein MF271_02415 (plasmid) [Deinococcus sp. KNUC1210]|uniref:hypothetical protein n=1 Tax=Deinococcus sp. KNUC1210 TaxID=2917691 RepID=UPI001EEF950F|nr:hypothetical protein [Deinococcus sp. KNUC1210]ULH14152.1 hypothetical protein MF271_02415 [Deinococcus sp. KNUC1210]
MRRNHQRPYPKTLLWIKKRSAFGWIWVALNPKKRRFPSIGQLAPFPPRTYRTTCAVWQQKILKRTLQTANGQSCFSIGGTIGQLAPFGLPTIGQLAPFTPKLSDNLRRFGLETIGQLAPKLSDNLRRFDPTIGQLAPF